MRDRYIQDTRIHCCLYFINPTGHSLRPIDVIVMKKLSEVVNVVPVIAKSDSLSLDERVAFKLKVGLCYSASFVFISLRMQIREELVYHNIRLYPFDTDENDEEELQLNESIRVRIPMGTHSFLQALIVLPST
jgi:septin 3/9/12